MYISVKFYYGTDNSAVDLHLSGLGVMVSAAVMWTGRKFRVPDYLDGAASIFVDSGGYTIAKSGVGYPYDFEEYNSFLWDIFDRYGTLVAACTPDYPLFAGNHDPTRIWQTIDIGWRIVSEMNENDWPWAWYIPLHGRTVDDYVAAARYFDQKRVAWYQEQCDVYDAGQPDLDDFETYESDILGTDVEIAIGSLKGRALDEVVAIITAVRQVLPHRGLHALGLGWKMIKDPRIRGQINSADSTVWRYGGSKWNRNPRYPQNHIQKIENLKRFKARLDGLKTQVSLEAWEPSNYPVRVKGAEREDPIGRPGRP